MKFGEVPVAEAQGTILGHSLRLPTGTWKKGRLLSATDIAALADAGLATVTVARAEQGDVLEDEAAERIAAAIALDADGQGVSRSAPFTGRANIFAAHAGVVEIDVDRVHALNAIDEALTLATLPSHTRVSARQMLATVKIIPYGLPDRAIQAAEELLAEGPLVRVHAPKSRSATLILTQTPGMKTSVLEKGAQAIRQRLMALEVQDIRERIVPHTVAALADAIAESEADIALILTASATSDRQDVGPAALVTAGGNVARFGMPVDPGNLLFLGEIKGTPVIGLPGCARSPKLNGADWVIERLVCGIPVGNDDIAAMGVGGLLKEIPSRPEPRAGGASAPSRPRVTAVLLAAGASSRMQGRDKLLELMDGKPMIRVVAERLLESQADEVVCVHSPNADKRLAALAGLDLRLVENPRADLGMGTSIAAGVAAIGSHIDAALVVLADMPDVTPNDFNRLIAAFDPGEGRAIVRATGASGSPGHPVLFGRRFFEALSGLDGDTGARDVISQHREFVTELALPGLAAITDLDTPEDWAAWRARRAG